jgi:predicted nucleic-acid-binding Zn-ribbon protein
MNGFASKRKESEPAGECPKCGSRNTKERTIRNEEKHKHKYCEDCTWGFVKRA